LLENVHMPTYDYECTACDHSFELFQSISEPVKRKCPACGKPKLRRLFGTGAALLVQGLGLLPDRLSQRLLQEGGCVGQAIGFRHQAGRKSAEAKSESKDRPWRRPPEHVPSPGVPFVVSSSICSSPPRRRSAASGAALVDLGRWFREEQGLPVEP
jgi:putative FmdB family regulatory protein